MDRFIDFAYFEFPQPAEFKIQYRQIYRADYNVIIGSEVNLKSNMDRFIVTPVQWFPSCPIFKIQYGQIYSLMLLCNYLIKKQFKIQYGQIYSSQFSVQLLLLLKFKIQYGQIYRKKEVAIFQTVQNLKSNMDRFIEYKPFKGHFCVGI